MADGYSVWFLTKKIYYNRFEVYPPPSKKENCSSRNTRHMIFFVTWNGRFFFFLHHRPQRLSFYFVRCSFRRFLPSAILLPPPGTSSNRYTGPCAYERYSKIFGRIQSKGNGAKDGRPWHVVGLVAVGLYNNNDAAKESACRSLKVTTQPCTDAVAVVFFELYVDKREAFPNPASPHRANPNQSPRLLHGLWGFFSLIAELRKSERLLV